MYMLRAYQSPASTLDCGPQCAQMPNLASLNQAGKREAWSEVGAAVKGPAVMGSWFCWEYADLKAGAAEARSAIALRRVIFMIEKRSPLGITVEAKVADLSTRCKLRRCAIEKMRCTVVFRWIKERAMV